ncbi:flagellar basal body P-ring protein [Planctomycetes bacterium MalM25]|nr:flagellar basal body P-ring protein [Planctomycetes bacterium MalM25]
MRPRCHQSVPSLLTLLGCVCLSAGCASTMLFRGETAEEALEKATEVDGGTPLIADIAYPWGLDYVKVEAIGLVMNLDGTGEDPPSSPQRAALLDEMSRRRVEKPNAILRNPDTALVLLRGYLPPGVQKGDKFDIEVRTPSRSQATSLRGGMVLPARMTELAVLGQQIRAGSVLAMGEGAILVDPSAGEDDTAATRGRILGGGVSKMDRNLGLRIGDDHQSAQMAILVAKAISDRFQTYDEGRKAGVAEAKTDEFVELQLHPRYKDNIGRFVRVVRSLPIRESNAEEQERLVLLEGQLLDPLTSARAALRLEAIGGDLASERLMAGLQSDDAEVRFYAAESLAYLDRTEAVGPLAEAARDEPAFRAHALTALSAMDDVVAYDALRSLLGSQSAETRYGAFRALWAMNPSDPMIRGEKMRGGFSYHVLDAGGDTMVHVTRSGRPELVLFGGEQAFELPMVLDAGADILINGLEGDEVTVSHFRSSKPTIKRTVTTSVDEVIRAIVEVGGDYPDVVQALQQAKREGSLKSRFQVDAIPRSGREYDPDEDEFADDTEAAEEEDAAYRVGTPLPDLFSNKK